MKLWLVYEPEEVFDEYDSTGARVHGVFTTLEVAEGVKALHPRSEVVELELNLVKRVWL